MAKSTDGTKTFERVGAIPWYVNNMGPVYLAELRTTGDVGAIEVNHMNVANGIDIGGDLTGQVTMKQYPANSSLPQPPQLIQMLIHGSLLADIDQPTSTLWGFAIKKLEVRGDIGTAAAPRNIWPLGNIEQITVPNGSIYANIDATSHNASHDIGRVDCNNLLSGFVKTRQFDPALASGLTSGVFTTVGDLTGTISTVLPMNQTIVIGGSITSAGLITMPVNGLTGQIVVKGANTTGVWNGFIKTGTLNLSPMPYYNNLPGDVGGGAAGLAPFRLHDRACVPENNSTFVIRHRDPNWLGEGDPPCVNVGFSANNEIKLRLYGNVTYVDQPPYFEITTFSGGVESPVAWPAQVTMPSPKDITIKNLSGQPWAAAVYHIRPALDETGHSKVICDDVNGNPAADILYVLTLLDSCAGDYQDGFDQNIDTRLNAVDPVFWLAHPSDLNGDGVIDAADFLMLRRVVEVFGEQ